MSFSTAIVHINHTAIPGSRDFRTFDSTSRLPAPWFSPLEIRFPIRQSNSQHVTLFDCIKQHKQHTDAFVEAQGQNATQLNQPRHEPQRSLFQGWRLSE